MQKRWKSILCVLIAAAICCSSVISVAAASYTDESGTYLHTKISHENNPVKTTDGIVDYIGNGVVSAADQGQGDRGQSYSWAAIEYGDNIYVSTCYNAMGNTLTLMDSALGNSFDAETMTAVLNVLYNGAFYTGEEDGGNTGGVLVKVNVKTGEVSLLMSKASTGESCLFRNACEYQGKLYFCGSVNSLPSIYEIDPETDAHKMIYQGMTMQDYIEGYIAGICTGIRGLCEFNGQLIVSCVTKEGPLILASDHPWDGQDTFTQIADQEDLFNYPAYHYEDSIYGGSIWEMVDFNGSLYVSICTGTPDNMPDENTMQSFALVRGDQDQDGNWSWTSVIGDQEKDGAKYTFGIDPSRTRAGAGVLMVYGDYLYIGEYNDEEIALENVLFHIDFDFVNENLRQSVNLYRMDKNEEIEMVVGDPTEMFPEGGISGIGSGFGHRENQYIWRMTEYNGKLFVGTFDTSSLLEPIAQFSNGDINNMTPEEWEQLLGFIRTLLQLQGGKDDTGKQANITASSDEETARMNRLVQLFDANTDAQLASRLTGTNVRMYSDEDENNIEIQELLKTVRGILTCSYYLKDSVRGFDCYVTDDGENFETITINGLGDPYNHGLRVFAKPDSGLCIGTANPFYGTQLWKLKEVTVDIASFTSNLDIKFDSSITDYTVTAAPNTEVFSFTMVPANLRNEIWVNGEKVEGFSAEVPLELGLNTVTVTNRSEDGLKSVTYTFQITVPPCDGGVTCPASHFTDVDLNRWYHEGLDYVVSNGIMNGVSKTEFYPSGNVTRGMIVTILYRLQNEPETEKELPFSDVSENRYFSEAVAWAAENQIAAGYPDGTFRPNQAVTRQEMAAFFWRYAKFAGYDVTVSEGATLTAYQDAGAVKPYANAAMLWAVDAGILKGMDNETLYPTGTASRAMAATVLYRMAMYYSMK